MFNYLLFPLSCCLPAFLGAQVVYDDFSLSQQQNAVQISWRIKSGSLCNGTTLFRTAADKDIKVAYIDGICGSEIEDKNYSLTDLHPVPNAANTYYLQFGAGEFTEKQTIFVRYLSPGQLYLSPNPAETMLLVEWRNLHNETYYVEIFSDSGASVLREKQPASETSALQVGTIPSGSYTIVLTTESGMYLSERWIKN